MADADQVIKGWWGKLQPKTKRVVSLVGLVGVLLFLSSIVAVSSSDKKGPRVSQMKEPERVNLVTPTRPDTSGEAIAAQMTALTTRMAQMENSQKQFGNEVSKALSAGGPSQDVSPELVRQMLEMQQKLDAIQRSGDKWQPPRKKGPGGSDLPSPNPNDPLPDPIPHSAPQATPAVAVEAVVPVEAPKPDAGPMLRVTGLPEDTGSGSAKPKSKADDAKLVRKVEYLTPGSTFEGVLLNGMDAPTSQVSQKNPVPAVLRIKGSAILPNRYSQNISECFLVVSGWGVLSSERAQLRTETLSCIRDDGQVLEAKLDGYIVGEDGKVGVRGRVVSKQGALVANALLTGMLSGFGQAMSPSQVPQLNISPTSTPSTQTADVTTVAKAGVFSGISNAAKTVSQFYMDMAAETFPVIEVDAGRKVTVMLVRGTPLEFKTLGGK